MDLHEVYVELDAGISVDFVVVEYDADVPEKYERSPQDIDIECLHEVEMEDSVDSLT